MTRKEQEKPLRNPKRSKKLIVMLGAVLVLLGSAGGGYLLTAKRGGLAAPTKGIVTPLTSAIMINLAGGHYLKLDFAMQQTASSGTVAVDCAPAVDSALKIYTGMSVSALSVTGGRNAAKAELLDALEKDYNTTSNQVVMDLYYTAFTIQ